MRALLTSVNATSHSRTGATELAAAMTVLGLGSLVAAMLLRQPELVALGVPFVLAMLFAITGHRDDTFAVHVEVDDERWVEGDLTELRVVVSSDVGIDRCEVELDLPPGMVAAAGSLRAMVRVHPGIPRVVAFPVELIEWGIFSPRALRVRASDTLGLLARDYRFTVESPMRVRLHEERLRTLLTPDRYRRVVGGHPSRDRGEGTELADVREYRSGDPMKWINWRISNRRREPWVTVRHPDRSATIIIVVDGYVLGGEKERAIARMAEALTKAHLDVQDRVGLLIAGPTPLWIEPQLGKRQMYRIADALLDVTATRFASERFDPNRVIPADAVVIGISTLDDRRIVDSFASLRSRGRTISVVEPSFPDANLTSTLATMHTEPLARRLYQLEREVSRRRLRERGLLVVPWVDGTPIEAPIAVLSRRQRGARA